MERQTYISEAQLEPLLREAERAGMELKDIWASIGRDYSTGSQFHPAQLSLVDYFRLEGEVARRLDDLTAHLSERKLTYQTGAFVTAQMNRSTTLTEALTNLAQYFNMMHGEHYNTVRITDRSVTLIIDDTGFPYTIKNDPNMVNFVGECVLIKVQCLLDSLSNGLAEKALRRVYLRREKTANPLGHLTFWMAPVSFGQSHYELSFDVDLANSDMPPPDEIDLSSEGVFSRVIAYLDARAPSATRQSFRSRTLDLVRNGITQQEIVAEHLSVSVATLRRRLESEATSFREILNAHLTHEATQLLSKGHSVSFVSDALDYSDIRAFNRAFKRWTGETPAKFAKRQSDLVSEE